MPYWEGPQLQAVLRTAPTDVSNMEWTVFCVLLLLNGKITYSDYLTFLKRAREWVQQPDEELMQTMTRLSKRRVG